VCRESIAAEGGIYIAASLVWLWLVEGQQPTGSDVVGASIAILGALVIVGLAARPDYTGGILRFTNS
jgi:drug/metabolite transporter superfamily protein YnfA